MNPKNVDPGVLKSVIQAIGRQFLTTNRLLAASAGALKESATAKPGEAGNQLPVAGYVTKFLGNIFARTSGALGPGNVANQALQANASGFEPFLQTVRFMGTVLSGFLTPGFVLLGAAVYAVSSYLASNLLSALRRFYQFIVEMVPDGAALQDALDKLEAAFNYAAGGIRYAVEEITNWVKENVTRTDAEAAMVAGPIPGVVNNLFRRETGIDLVQNVKDQFRETTGGGVVDHYTGAGGGFSYDAELAKVKAKNERIREERAATGRRAPGEPNKPEEMTFGERFVKGLDVMQRLMAQANAAPARSTSLVGAAQQAQMVAFGTGEIDKEILKVNQEILAASREFINTLKSRLQPAVGH